MTSRVHFYGFNGRTGSYRNYHSMIEMFAAGAMPVGWEYDDFDRDYIAEQDRYSLIEMYNADGDCVEVLLFDNEPVGVLDDATIGKADLIAQFETLEQTAYREGAEDAARELNAEARRECA